MSTLSMHPLTKTLLEKRGITDLSAQEHFLYPDYGRDTYDPFLILNMEKAVERILSAMQGGERIVVYGDYDCDGIPGSVILHDLFTKLGYKNFFNYIPHRHLEGYGLNSEAVSQLRREGITLMITVDCGITDVLEVALAQELGMDVIVTDHHLPQAVLPPAYAVINSKQKGDTYTDPMLCGAGVAWKLAQAILSRGNFPDVGFTIGPRINTASRMDVPLRAFELLSTQDPAIGGDMAKHLANLNGERKLEVARMMKEAKKVLRERVIRDVIVLGNPSWRVGVVGIVANQLAEEHDRPVFVWGREGSKEGSTVIKGSCRSDGRVNLVDLMVAVKDGIFIDKGGHEFSGGFSVSYEHIHLLEDALIEAHGLIPKKEKEKGNVRVDAELTLDEVNEETFSAVDLYIA